MAAGGGVSVAGGGDTVGDPPYTSNPITCRSAAAISAARMKRPSGAFAIALRITSSRPGGNDGANFFRGDGVSLMCCITIPIGVSDSNGNFPAIIW